MREHRRNLERAHEPEARNVRGPDGGNVLALVEDLAARRAQKLGEEIKARGLAGAVRPDERVDRAALDPEVHSVDRHEACEFLGEILGFEDDLATHPTRQLPLPAPFTAATAGSSSAVIVKSAPGGAQE